MDQNIPIKMRVAELNDTRRLITIRNSRPLALWTLDSNGNAVHANDAAPGETYICPDCGTPVHVTHRGDKKFFACYPNKPHMGELCKKSKSVYRDPAATNPTDFFAGLFKSSKKRPPTGGHGPAVGPVEGVFACTSLDHFWKAGFHVHHPKDGMVGSHKLHEFMITRDNAAVIMNDNAPLSHRMIVAQPDGYDKEQKALRFVVLAGGVIKQKKIFYLVFGKEHEEDFKQLRYELYFAKDSSSIEEVLIAADWLDASLPMCEIVCDKSCPDPKWECTGMQVGRYVSKRQIYIPKKVK